MGQSFNTKSENIKEKFKALNNAEDLHISPIERLK